MPDENLPKEHISEISSDSSDDIRATLLYLSNSNKVEYLSNGTLLINGDLLKNTENNSLVSFQNEDKARIFIRRHIYQSDFHIQNITKSDNLLILTGAGSSIFADQSVSGKSMKDLYDAVFDSIPSTIPEFATANWLFECTKFCEEDQRSKNLESLISRIDTAMNFYLDGQDYNTLQLWKEYIIKTIKDLCSFSEKADFNAEVHRLFLSKVTTRKLSYNRTKIFTLNYDTAFEKGAEKSNIVLIDGFTFSQDASFHNDFFDYDIVKRKGSRISDEENFLPNIAYLYKLHGSINWCCENGKIFKRSTDDDNFVMVMPSKNKYEQSYKPPYFDMMARFQAELRKNIPSTLLIVGYSFGDEHINSMIKDAVNRCNFNVVIVSPIIPLGDCGNEFQRELISATNEGNVTFVGDYFKEFTESLPVQRVYANGD